MRELQKLPRGTTPDVVGSLLEQAEWGSTPEQLTALMMVVHKAQRWRAATMLADWAQHQRLELSTMQYNLLISACARTRPRRALAIFRRMQASPAPCDAISYNNAIAAASRSSNLELAPPPVGTRAEAARAAPPPSPGPLIGPPALLSAPRAARALLA
jgi:hypothetical protein